MILHGDHQCGKTGRGSMRGLPAMILVSVLASIVLTVMLNFVLR